MVASSNVLERYGDHRESNGIGKMTLRTSQLVTAKEQ